ncbi:hypothetical protein [Shewanella fodinae]|uniref:hypothetical protein n=1 Tax=Shewanella fodinae TaxID=552357 RepID=UPI00167765EB|nr:hypothetical protein [Shewanella fodinae]MCL2906857.1 hypothetical protein [Shewanella fodinae]GGZ04074.1 hypothetical protein GCM10007169_21060 [Shewanella fodinae]
MNSKLKAFLVIFGLTLGFGINNAISAPDAGSCETLGKICAEDPSSSACALYNGVCQICRVDPTAC